MRIRLEVYNFATTQYFETPFESVDFLDSRLVSGLGCDPRSDRAGLLSWGRSQHSTRSKLKPKSDFMIVDGTEKMHNASS